jgi:hypothetical protein
MIKIKFSRKNFPLKFYLSSKHRIPNPDPQHWLKECFLFLVDLHPMTRLFAVLGVFHYVLYVPYVGYAFLKLLTVFDLFITPVFCCVQEHSATCRAEDKQRVRADLEKFRGDTWLNVAGKKFKVSFRTRSLISSALGWGLRGLVLAHLQKTVIVVTVKVLILIIFSTFCQFRGNSLKLILFFCLQKMGGYV